MPREREGPGRPSSRRLCESRRAAVVIPAGLEPATYGLGNRRSIQLSYGTRNFQHCAGGALVVQVAGARAAPSRSAMSRLGGWRGLLWPRAVQARHEHRAVRVFQTGLVHVHLPRRHISGQTLVRELCHVLGLELLHIEFGKLFRGHGGPSVLHCTYEHRFGHVLTSCFLAAPQLGQSYFLLGGLFLRRLLGSIFSRTAGARSRTKHGQRQHCSTHCEDTWHGRVQYCTRVSTGRLPSRWVPPRNVNSITKTQHAT